MSKNKKKKKHRKFFLGLKIAILSLLVIILIGSIWFYFAYGDDLLGWQSDAKKMVSESTLETFRASETSLVYNSAGKQIAVLKGDKDMYYLSYDKIPKDAINAMIVTEDKNFYEHAGVDIKGNVRALLSLIKNRGKVKQGASTITQQLARNVFLNFDKTYERKIKEIFVALEMEKKYSKEQILEFYMNNIYFANGYYGIEAASKGYFSKTSSELSLGQLIFLCAIPNNPSLYNPTEHMDNTVTRKNRILDQMLEDGVITSAQYDSAYNEEITLDKAEVKKKNYIQTYVTYCAVKKIMALKGFTFKYDFATAEEREGYEQEFNEMYSDCQKTMYTSGYRIYTSIDTVKQRQLQKAVNDTLRSFNDKTDEGIYKMQGAAVCIDNSTGRVCAIVGGRTQKTVGYTLNRAYQSYRQPGSSIKPILVYTPSLERDYTPNSIVSDRKTKDGPSNSDNSYWGSITLRTAVEQSKNTVAWDLFDKLTPKVGLQYLKNMNFYKIDKNDYYLSSSLGGLTYGVSPVEMASGYSTIENDGKFREPTCIIKITDADGNVVIDDSINEKEIYKQNAAREMVDIMEGVFTRGTARGLGLSNMACAGKTGTTSDKKDGWFCGFTPYYTTSVWVGYDQPKSVEDLLGNTYPGKIWNTFMSQIHDGVKNIAFEKYEGESSSSKPAATKKPKATKAPSDDDADATPTPTDTPTSTPDTTVDDGSDTDDWGEDDVNQDDGYSTDDTQYQDSGF